MRGQKSISSKPSTFEAQHTIATMLLMLWEFRLYGKHFFKAYIYVQSFTFVKPFITHPPHIHNPARGYTKPLTHYTHRMHKLHIRSETCQCIAMQGHRGQPVSHQSLRHRIPMRNLTLSAGKSSVLQITHIHKLEYVYL